jgi:hypothetical protein
VSRAADPAGRRAPAGRWELLDEQLGILWRALLLAALTLLAFRVALLLQNGRAAGTFPREDLGRAFLMGSRFDLKVAAILFGPALLLLGGGRIAAGPGAPRAVAAAPLAWALVGLGACDLLAIVNHFYYAFYRSPINPLIFGLAEDDTAAVLSTVWKDYPVIRAALGLAALLWVQRRVLSAGGLLRLPGPAARGAALLITLAAVPFLARGRTGTFPLRDFDLVVSSHPFVNDLVPSGPEALFVSWQQRNEGAIAGDVSTRLRRAGFGSPLEAAAVLGIRAATEGELLSALYPPAPPGPVRPARPPHVVIALMESWSADLLTRHSPANDLLGRLAPHVAHGSLFRHFAQIDGGTDGSLEGLLLSTPIRPLTYGQHGYRPYDTSAALPFARAGYRTVFVTGGTGGWRKLDRVLPRQGFAEFHDQHDIEAAFPGAPRHTWGVHDGPMFRYAAGLLLEADRTGRPLFLVLLTTSNHPPHEVPADYAVGPLDPAAMGPVAVEPELARAILRTTQYACDALGEFLDRVESAGLGERTLLAAFGDHNTRRFYEYPDTRTVDRQYGVPLLLHLPATLLAGRRADAERHASPRDLVPTLARLAIPGQPVFASGQDLLEPAARPRALSGYEVVMAAEGAVIGLDNPVLLARGPDGSLSPCQSGPCRAVLERLAAEERAYVALLDWNIRRQALAR